MNTDFETRRKELEKRFGEIQFHEGIDSGQHWFRAAFEVGQKEASVRTNVSEALFYNVKRREEAKVALLNQIPKVFEVVKSKGEKE